MNTHIHITLFFSYNNNMSLQTVRTEHLSPSNKGHSYLQRQLSRFWWHRGDFLAKSSLLQLKALLKHSHHGSGTAAMQPHWSDTCWRCRGMFNHRGEFKIADLQNSPQILAGEWHEILTLFSIKHNQPNILWVQLAKREEFGDLI